MSTEVCKQCILQRVPRTILLSCRSQNRTQFSGNMHTACNSQNFQHLVGFFIKLDCLIWFFIHRTARAFSPLIRRGYSQRGRFRTSILHREKGRPAAGHLVVFPRLEHHLRAGDRHHSVGGSRQLFNDSHRWAQAQGHLHLQSSQCSRSANRNSGS